MVDASLGERAVSYVLGSLRAAYQIGHVRNEIRRLSHDGESPISPALLDNAPSPGALLGGKRAAFCATPPTPTPAAAAAGARAAGAKWPTPTAADLEEDAKALPVPPGASEAAAKPPTKKRAKTPIPARSSRWSDAKLPAVVQRLYASTKGRTTTTM